MCLGPSIIHRYPRSSIQSYTYWEGLLQRCIGGFPQMHRALLDRMSSQSLAIQPYITHTHTHVGHHVNIYILRRLRKKGIGLFFKVYRALLVRRCFESFAKRETKLGKRAGYDRIYSLINRIWQDILSYKCGIIYTYPYSETCFDSTCCRGILIQKRIQLSWFTRVLRASQQSAVLYAHMNGTWCIHMLIATLLSSMGIQKKASQYSTLLHTYECSVMYMYAYLKGFFSLGNRGLFQRV